MENAQNQNQGLRIYAIVVTALLLLTTIFGIVYWRKSGGYLMETREQGVQLDALAAEKARLETSLDSLQNSFASLRSENETLEGKATAATEMIAEKDALIQKIRARSSRDLKELRAQVESLQKAKTEYETVIAVLRAENEQLVAENDALKTENAGLKGSNDELTAQVSDLAKKLEDQVRRTQSASFKATSFRVEVERRNDKLTARAKKARELMVSFDLADVPVPFQGPQKLYLSITDENGKPIAAQNPATITIHAPSGDIPIIAQQTRMVNLETTQRLAFTYKLEERLSSGNYVVAIYCDKGLLGVSSLRLAK